jgi:hypothetical protein
MSKEQIDISKVHIPEITMEAMQGSVTPGSMEVDYGEGMATIGRGDQYDIDLNEEEVTIGFPDGTSISLNDMNESQKQ